MVSRLAGVASDGVAVDPHEPLGLTDATVVGDLPQDGDGLLLGQVRVEQRGAPAFGEAIAAGAASEEADRGGLAVVTADGEVVTDPDAMVGAAGIQAAEAREVVHGPPPATYVAGKSMGCDFSSGQIRRTTHCNRVRTRPTYFAQK